MAFRATNLTCTATAPADDTLAQQITSHHLDTMAIFPSKKFRPTSYNNSFPARYRTALAKHPFALFGLPFIATMVLGSFFLTPATALRFERHDRKVRQMTKEEELGIGKDRRKIDMKEEYYVSKDHCCVGIAWC